MINITDKYDCCGCEACVQACPKHCISFEEDLEGFRYPRVDTSRCVKCGLCEKVCPELHHGAQTSPLCVYASKNRNESIRLSSSSGGIFTLLAEQVISQGGVVFGAKFNKDWGVIHSYTETIEGIEDFRTSKYVQSRIGNSFNEACSFLKQGRKVLFSGTSCQIAALKLFLHKEYDNLLTVDFICHGVPSPKVWRLYLDVVKKHARKGENSVSSPLIPIVSERDTSVGKGNVEIGCISFRDKRLGWKKFSFALTLAEASADGKPNTVSLSSMHMNNPFMKAFLGDIILRPSCHNCPSKNGKSCSDITLADFWGVNKQIPDFDDDKGVGLTLINSSKGLILWEAISCNVVFKCVTLETALSNNPAYYRSKRENPKRNLFFKDLKDDGENLLFLIDKYTKISICEQMFRLRKRVWKKLMKIAMR